MSAGADFECKNNSGYTAIDMTGFMHYQTKSSEIAIWNKTKRIEAIKAGRNAADILKMV